MKSKPRGGGVCRGSARVCLQRLQHAKVNYKGDRPNGHSTFTKPGQSVS